MHSQELTKIIKRRKEADRVITVGQVNLAEYGTKDVDLSWAIDVYEEDMVDCESALYVSKTEADADYKELLTRLPIHGITELDMWVKKDTTYKAAGYGHIAIIPAGTFVQPATNLPPDADGKRGFFTTPWPGMDDKAEGWHRGYGFHLDDNEVEPVPTIKPSAMLDMSTGHLSKLDKSELDRMAMGLRREAVSGGKFAPFRVYDTEYGFIVYVNSDITEVKKECVTECYKFTDTFWKTYQYAMKTNCILINYDRDAEQQEGIATFEDDEDE